MQEWTCGTAVAPARVAMALHLYRRHRPTCEGGHVEDSYSSELDERRKGWRRVGASSCTPQKLDPVAICHPSSEMISLIASCR
jgi:hypothetical protein